MQPRRNRREMTPHLYGTHGCSCVRKNPNPEDAYPFAMIGLMGLIFVGAFIYSKPIRDAKVEKDLALAQAIRDGKIKSLTVGEIDGGVG